MNPASLNEKIEVLSISNKYLDTYLWSEDFTTWACVEYSDKVNLFSRVGIGAKTIKFIIRKRNLTLHNAFKWRGRHCFLTDIKELDKRYLEITAAQVEPVECKLTRNIPSKDELNRPKLKQGEMYTFPGCLVEKYQRYQQQIPQTINTITYVLVTPKIIDLLAGDLIKIGDLTYNIQLIHNLDEYKNEYEISIIKEV